MRPDIIKMVSGKSYRLDEYKSYILTAVGTGFTALLEGQTQVDLEAAPLVSDWVTLATITTSAPVTRAVEMPLIRVTVTSGTATFHLQKVERIVRPEIIKVVSAKSYRLDGYGAYILSAVGGAFTATLEGLVQENLEGVVSAAEWIALANISSGLPATRVTETPIIRVNITSGAPTFHLQKVARAPVIAAAGGAATPLSNSTPQPSGTAAPGVATDASRSDHVHIPPTATQVGLSAVTNDAQVKRTELAAVSGVATLGADGILLLAQRPASGGGVAVSNVTPSPTGTASAGVGADASRFDHVHANPTATQVGLGSVTNDSQVKRSEMAAASGVATLGADGILLLGQRFSVVALSNTTPQPNGTAAAGVATDASRSDHVHAASAGSSPTITIFSTVGTATWTKPSGAKVVRVIGKGSGAGGGSGRLATTGDRYGGGGGSAGAYIEATFDAVDLPATVTVTVTAGSAGGAAVTTTTNGLPGAATTSTSFGTFVIAAGGNFGGGGTNTVVGAGGVASGVGSPYSSGAGGDGTLGVGAAGGSSGYGGGSGGGGAGIPAATGATGGVGGTGSAFRTGTVATGGGGAAGVAATPGTVGTSRAWGLGDGGGGGGSSNGANASAGGAGGTPGGGGGGGGAGTNTTSGAGGAGARGEVVVMVWF